MSVATIEETDVSGGGAGIRPRLYFAGADDGDPLHTEAVIIHMEDQYGAEARRKELAQRAAELAVDETRRHFVGVSIGYLLRLADLPIYRRMGSEIRYN